MGVAEEGLAGAWARGLMFGPTAWKSRTTSAMAKGRNGPPLAANADLAFIDYGELGVETDAG